MKSELKVLRRFLTIFSLLLSASIGVSAQRATRVVFPKRATAVNVSGSLRGYQDKKVYRIKVRSGQTMKIEQIRRETSFRYITVSISDPKGAPATDGDASCGSRREVAPTAAGDYKITVYECRKADEWRGRFRMKISVK